MLPTPIFAGHYLANEMDRQDGNGLLVGFRPVGVPQRHPDPRQQFTETERVG